MRRVILAAAIGLVGLGIAMPATAILVDRKMARTVIVVAPFEPDIVELNKMMWEKGQPVPPIYGQPFAKPMRIVKPKPESIIIPEEDPSLTLMKGGGADHPLQVVTLYYIAKMAGVPCIILGLFGFAIWRIKRPAKVEATPA